MTDSTESNTLCYIEIDGERIALNVSGPSAASVMKQLNHPAVDQPHFLVKIPGEFRLTAEGDCMPVSQTIETFRNYQGNVTVINDFLADLPAEELKEAISYLKGSFGN